MSVIPLDSSLSNPFRCSWVFCIVFLCCFLYFCQQVDGRLLYKWVINKGFHYHDSRKSPLQRYQTLGGCLFLFIILTICSSEALEWGIVISPHLFWTASRLSPLKKSQRRSRVISVFTWCNCVSNYMRKNIFTQYLIN